VWPVEVSALAVFFEGRRRATPLEALAAQSDKQRLNPGPFQTTIHWIGKNGFKRFPVLAVHALMIALFVNYASIG